MCHAVELLGLGGMKMRVIVYEFVCVGADVRNFAFWVGDCGREKVMTERLT